MFLSIGMLKQKYFLADIFILSAEKQPIKLSWRKIECLLASIQLVGLQGGSQQVYTVRNFLFEKFRLKRFATNVLSTYYSPTAT